MSSLKSFDSVEGVHKHSQKQASLSGHSTTLE